MKTGLIRTCILEYIHEHNLNEVQTILDNLPQIYKYLKNHPHHKNLLPDNLTYDIFVKQAMIGLNLANMQQHYF